MRGFFATCSLSLLLATNANAALFDFSDFSAGTIAPSLSNSVFSVTASGGIDEVGVLKTVAPSVGTANDPDLKSPFENVDNASDVRAFGNALIIQDNKTGGPDDNAGGGNLTFTFVNAVTIDRVDLLDIEERSTIKLFDAENNLLAKLSGQVDNKGLPNDGPNQFKSFFFDTAGVSKMQVKLRGSGAVGEFTAQVPLPAGGLMLLSGLGGLAIYRRRRAAK